MSPPAYPPVVPVVYPPTVNIPPIIIPRPIPVPEPCDPNDPDGPVCDPEPPTGVPEPGTIFILMMGVLAIWYGFGRQGATVTVRR